MNKNEIYTQENNLKLLWPNGKRVAVYITGMLEVWSEGKAPEYTVQTTNIGHHVVDYGGIEWSNYGGKIGVFRLLRLLEDFKIKATFATNSMICEIFPEAIKAITHYGHDIAGHGIWQDEMINELKKKEQHELIKKCLDMFESHTGKRPQGWLSQVLAFTPDTPEILVQEGVKWWGDLKSIDLPKKVKTNRGDIIAILVCEYTDNRVLRGAPKDYFDVNKETFDYLYQNEPFSVLNIIIHCQWGGRPPVMAMLKKTLEYLSQFPDVWFTTPLEISQLYIANNLDEISYSDRFLSGHKNV